jgi:hypothetical protein
MGYYNILQPPLPTEIPPIIVDNTNNNVYPPFINYPPPPIQPHLQMTHHHIEPQLYNPLSNNLPHSDIINHNNYVNRIEEMSNLNNNNKYYDRFHDKQQQQQYSNIPSRGRRPFNHQYPNHLSQNQHIPTINSHRNDNSLPNEDNTFINNNNSNSNRGGGYNRNRNNNYNGSRNNRH